MPNISWTFKRTLENKIGGGQEIGINVLQDRAYPLGKNEQ